MDNLLDHLAAIGLGQYEARIYRYLMQQNPVSATDLTRHLGIPAGRTYAALDSLVAKGFCVTVPGKRKSFAPVKPEVAIERLAAERRKQADAWDQSAAQAIEQLEAELAESTDLSSAWDFVRVYTTAESMTTKFWQLCFDGRSVIRAINKPPYVMSRRSSRRRPNRDLENLEKLLQGDTDVRTLIEEEAEATEDFIHLARACATGGKAVRVGRALPLKLHIFDQEAVLITMAIRPSSRQQVYSLLIEHREFCAAMIDLYEMHWARAIPLDEYLAGR